MMAIPGEVAMDLRELSPKDLALIEALAEIARAEHDARSWREIEPMLAACWNDTHRFVSTLSWEAVAPYIRAACERQH